MSLPSKYQFKLSTQLKRGLTEEQVDSINNEIGMGRRYLNLIVARIEKELDDKIKESESLSYTETPNWSIRQADIMGYRRALRKVLDIMGPETINGDS